MNNRILITGDQGFVGTHFKKYFADWEDFEIFRCDLKSGQDCRDLFRQGTSKFALIIHLAAIIGGRATIENEPLKVATDLEIDSLFWQWVVRTKQPRVVYYSSSAAYPIGYQNLSYHFTLAEHMIDLNHIQTPDQSYGWSKLSGEMLAGYAKAEGTNVHILRPFSGYGEDQSLDYPFPSFIKRIKDKANPFEIWGDGTQTRDFIHIDDVVEATMRVVELDIQEPINLGTGIPTSFNHLASLMFNLSGFHPEVKLLTDNPVGVHYRVANAQKMLKFYEPKISLQEGIERALNANI